jgi:hypothetical protein
MEHKELNLLNESLGFHNNNLFGRFVLVEDTVDTNAAFVLHHILKRSFSSHPSSSVIFLALSHPFSHYDRILRKIVISLSLSLSLSLSTFALFIIVVSACVYVYVYVLVFFNFGNLLSFVFIKMFNFCCFCKWVFCCPCPTPDTTHVITCHLLKLLSVSTC